MSLNSAPLNTVTLNGSGSSIIFTGVLSEEQDIGVTQVMVSAAETLSVQLTQRLYETDLIAVGLQQVNTETIYSVTVGLQQELYIVGSASVGLTQSQYTSSSGAGVTPAGTVIPAGLNSPSDESSYWSAHILLDGADVSVNVTRTVRVDNEEGAASVATFTLKPTAGSVDLTKWVKSPVAITYIKTNSAGQTVTSFPLFKGFVDVPSYDATNRQTTFTCSDELQRAFESMTTPQIDAEVGGFWSKEVFEEDTDKWSYAMDRMSTIPYSLNYDVNRALVKTPWAAKASPDFLLNEAVILDGTLGVTLANSRAITNYVELDVNYQYEAYKARQVRYVWKMLPTVQSGDFSPYGWKPVLNSMVLDASVSDSWVLAAEPRFTPWPPSGWYKGVVVLNAATTAVVGAVFTCAKRYQQSVMDGYRITLKSSKSIGSLGVLKDSQEYSISANYSEEAEGFEETAVKTGSYAAELNTVVSAAQSSNGLTSFNLVGTVDVPFEYTTYANSFTEKNVDGEIEYDLSAHVKENTRNDFEGVLQVVQNLHKTTILKSHRGNSVSATSLIEPNITRESTVRIETDTVIAQGKVRQVEHILDVSAGTALTNVVIGVSRSTAVGVTDEDTPLDAVTDAPDVLHPPTNSNGVYDNHVFLGNYVQRIPGSLPIGENAFGMQAYYNDTEFLVNFPEISAENAETVDSSTEQYFSVDVPNEDLTLNA